MNSFWLDEDPIEIYREMFITYSHMETGWRQSFCFKICLDFQISLLLWISQRLTFLFQTALIALGLN